MIAFIIGFVLGAWVGVGLMCILATNKAEEI